MRVDMNDVPTNEALDDQSPDHARATLGHSTSNGRTTSLRGAEPAKIGRTFWLVTGASTLVVFAAIIVVSFLSATNDNARIDRMKLRGIPVTVIVTSCVGNIGGSGSNVTGYTCRGTYTLGSTHYREIIGSMSNFAVPGTSERALVDPSRHSTLELSSAVRASTASPKKYVAPGLLGLVLVALALALWRVARRPGTLHRTPRASHQHEAT
jgi:hypothetical protein